MSRSGSRSSTAGGAASTVFRPCPPAACSPRSIRHKYEVVTVGITRAGQWVLTDAEPDRLAISDGALPEVTAAAAAARRFDTDCRRPSPDRAPATSAA